MMVIKNKDGSIFVLSKPNPLTRNQEWENLILYNCHWRGEVVPDVYKKPLKMDLPKVELPSIEIPEPKSPEEVVVEVPKQGFSEKTLKNIVKVYCLPANVIIEKDELYDEERQTIQYGDKFAFEAVVIERGDLQIRLWTMHLLDRQSIIFPSVYVKGDINFGDYRWWKVNTIEEKSGGYIITAIPSDTQPDFS